jgi:hypothetical protein
MEEQENQKQTLHTSHGDIEDQLKKIENKMKVLQAEKVETEKR